MKRLISRVQVNFNEACHKTIDAGAEGFQTNMPELSAIETAYKRLTKTHTFNETEVNYLLKFQNPLMVVTDYILPILEEIDFTAVMYEITNREDIQHSSKYAMV